MSDGDGMDQAVSGTAMLALTAAARAGQRLAQELQRTSRQTADRARLTGAQRRERLAAEQAAASAYFEAVRHPDYLANAPQRDLEDAYRQAKAWQERYPQAAEAERAVSSAYRQRFGVDPAAAGTGSADTNRQVEAAQLLGHSRAADEASHTQRPEPDAQPATAAEQAAQTAGKAQQRPAAEATSQRSVAEQARRTPVAGRQRATGLER